MNTVRQAATWICRVLITLFAAAVIVEVFLAGSSCTASALCAASVLDPSMPTPAPSPAEWVELGG